LTGDAKVVEIDIEFGYGYPEVWHKLGYAEYEEMSDLQGQIQCEEGPTLPLVP
jgi:hypothetical protein